MSEGIDRETMLMSHLIGDIRYAGVAPEKEIQREFLKKVATLMSEHKITKVDLCWNVIPKVD
jgi:hypothetical protein